MHTGEHTAQRCFLVGCRDAGVVLPTSGSQFGSAVIAGLSSEVERQHTAAVVAALVFRRTRFNTRVVRRAVLALARCPD